MDFSETFRYSGPSPAYSPDGRYLAMAVEYRLVVRDVETLQVVQLYSCLDKIQYLEWSCDSQYVLCALFKRAIAQVWSIEEPDWTCKIDEGPAGIAHARWAPDGRHILTVADFHIRITVWSLISRSCVYINGPKFVDKALAFRPDGSLMALAERKNCKDAITILSTSDWTAQTTFATATMDLSDLSWSPDGGCIAVWDSLLEYKVLLYTEEGECLASYAAYSDALGVKSLQWAPNGQFLAVGSYDESARLLNHVTWSPFFEMAHTPKIEGPSSCVAYKEIVEVNKTATASKDTNVKARYVVSALPASCKYEKPPMDKANPKLGVGVMKWSSSGKYLATRCDSMPATVWVWDCHKLELAAALMQVDEVAAFGWDPTQDRLAICSGSTRVYLWSPDGASCVHVPLPSFQACNVGWNPNGSAFVLTDRDVFCCAFLA